jgi:hypothetical protein
MHPTPLRGPKIVAILKVGFIRQLSRFIGAARVMGKPLGHPCAMLSCLVHSVSAPARLAHLHGQRYRACPSCLGARALCPIAWAMLSRMPIQFRRQRTMPNCVGNAVAYAHPVWALARQAQSGAQRSGLTKRVAQQALAADRFAHEIMAISARGSGPHPISFYRCGG